MATVDRDDIIVSKAYEYSCDFSWSPDLTEPLPSGVISVPMEHCHEFVKVCGHTNNDYVVVSQRSDLGLAYQKEFSVALDMHKWVSMLPHMGKEVCDFASLGYNKLVIPPR